MLYKIGVLIYVLGIASIISLLLYVNKHVEFEPYEYQQAEKPTFKQHLIYSLTILQLILLFLGLTAVGTMLALQIQKSLLIPENILLAIKTDDFNVFTISWMFIVLPIAGLIVVFFHHKDYDYVSVYKGLPPGSAEENFVPLMVMLLIIFVIAFPFSILGIGDYFYFTDDYIGVDRYWSVKEKHYSYWEVDEVYVNYRKAPSVKEAYGFYYDIYFKDGTSEVIFVDFRNDLVKVDNIFKSKGVIIERDELSTEDYADIKESYTEHFIRVLEKIYIIEGAR